MFITTKTELTDTYLPPATKLRQGNVFTPVCDSVHREGGLCLGGLCPGPGGSLSSGGGLCPGRALSGGGLCPGRSLSRGGLCLGGSLSGRRPRRCTVMHGRYAPTGMHSCFTCLFGITVYDQESGTKIRLRANKSF